MTIEIVVCLSRPTHGGKSTSLISATSLAARYMTPLVSASRPRHQVQQKASHRRLVNDIEPSRDRLDIQLILRRKH